MGTWLCVALVLAPAAFCQAAVRTAGGGPPLGAVEQMLPKETFFYAGVSDMDAAFARVEKFMAQAGMKFNAGKMYEELAEPFGARRVRTRNQFFAETGLKPHGSAAVVFVAPACLDLDLLEYNWALIAEVDRLHVVKAGIERGLDRLQRTSRRICSRQCRAVDRLIQDFAKAHPGQAPTWAALRRANRGLGVVQCPGGGQYALGKSMACSVHGSGRTPKTPAATDRSDAWRRMGDVMLFGGRSLGTGFAHTQSHIILANNMNVLEKVTEAAAGKRPRATLKQPKAGAGLVARCLFDPELLKAAFGHEFDRERNRRRAPFAVKRILRLFRSLGPVSAEVQIADYAVLSLDAKIAPNPDTKRLLATPPSQLGALRLLPPDSILAVGANLGKDILRITGDFAMLDERGLGAALKMMSMATNGDAAFAFTTGATTEGIPNMVMVLRVSDPQAMQDAEEMFMGFLAEEANAKIQEEPEGTALKLRDGQMFYLTRVDGYSVFATSGEAMRAVLQAAGNPQAGLAKNPGYREAVQTAGQTNLLAVVHMPALADHFSAADHARRQRSRNGYCRNNLTQLKGMAAQMHKATGRYPGNRSELYAHLKEKAGRRRHVWVPQDNCPMFGGVKYTFNAATGAVTCPKHGTTASFRQMEAPWKRGAEERLLATFGLGALRLTVTGDGLSGDASIVPMPQK